MKQYTIALEVAPKTYHTIIEKAVDLSMVMELYWEMIRYNEGKWHKMYQNDLTLKIQRFPESKVEVFKVIEVKKEGNIC